MIPPRLRGCCDNCTRSKLKCSGERPCCQRCRLRGQDCIYSKARRAGRPRLKSKRSNKPSATTSTDHKPPTPITSHDNQLVSGFCYLDRELPLSSPREPALPSPDSCNIASLTQDTWNPSPTISLGFVQASSGPELGDLMLHDFLWNTEGFNSVPSGNIGLGWNPENATISQVLEDSLLDQNIITDRTPSHSLANTSSSHSDTTQNTNNSSDLLTEVDVEINSIIASIAEITEQSMTTCISSWPQLLSKAQLLMYVTGANTSSLRLDAVLQVSWAAEQVQKRISESATCPSQEIEISSMLVLMYDWITKTITSALESPAVMQSCQLIIGNSVLTGQKSIIGVYELVKHRMARAMRVIENVKSRVASTEQRDPDKLCQVVQLMFQGVESQLEALSGMIDLLASEQC